MTLVSVTQEVCPVIGLAVPTAVAASTTREHIELFALAKEMAERIGKAHEWELLKAVATITGDGSTVAYNFPADYDRMLKKGHLWSSSLETALSHITDSDKWLELDVQSFDYVINAWTIYGGQIHMKPALANAVTAKYFYIKNTIIAPASGDDKATFTADDDSFKLDERLLKLGMIWQWRANKGLAYAEDMATYERELEKAIEKDKGSRILTMGRPKLPRDAVLSYPGTINTP